MLHNCAWAAATSSALTMAPLLRLEGDGAPPHITRPVPGTGACAEERARLAPWLAMQKKTSSASRAKIAQARLLYDAGAPIAEILDLLAMSAAQFRRFREENGWPLRASACKRKADPPARRTPALAADPGRLISRLEEAVEREFARAEAALEKQAPKTLEASARTIATLVKALAELKRIRREADAPRANATSDDDHRDHGAEPPRELAELRAELARRLERLRGERASR